MLERIRGNINSAVAALDEESGEEEEE